METRAEFRGGKKHQNKYILKRLNYIIFLKRVPISQNTVKVESNVIEQYKIG